MPGRLHRSSQETTEIIRKLESDALDYLFLAHMA
jgi:hypothetical protein